MKWVYSYVFGSAPDLQDGAPYIIYYYYAIITAMLGALSFENDKNVQNMKSLSSFAGFLS